MLISEIINHLRAAAQRLRGRRGHRPDPQRVIFAPREEFRPVGAEVQAKSALGVTGERGAELGSVADIPQPDAAVSTARRGRAPVRAERIATPTAASVRIGSPRGWKVPVSHSPSVLSKVPTASR